MQDVGIGICVVFFVHARSTAHTQRTPECEEAFTNKECEKRLGYTHLHELPSHVLNEFKKRFLQGDKPMWRVMRCKQRTQT